MALDYKMIGRKIRQFRKAEGFSQEELAEKVNISVTHMSNIETGNTKLSLTVLYDIAETLKVGTDEILNRHGMSKTAIREEIAAVLDTCSQREQDIIKDAVKEIKVLLEKHKIDEV